MDWRLAHKIADARLSVAHLKLRIAFVKYDPNQPRIPAGQSTGGQWVGRNQLAGKWDETRRQECEAQYESDILQCRMVLWNPFCEDQARSRMTACMKGNPVPPFFHIGAKP
jgi:hypothetical protein